jgi:hypothetical protein
MEVETMAPVASGGGGADCPGAAAGPPSPRDIEPGSDYTFAELANLVLAEHAAALAAGGGVAGAAAAAAVPAAAKRVRGESPAEEDMERFDWTI